MTTIPTTHDRRLLTNARIALRVLVKSQNTEIALRASLALQALNLRNPLPDGILIEEDREPVEF